MSVPEPAPRPYTVYIYQCPNDKSVMVTPYKAQYGNPYLCPMCRRYMRRLYEEKTAVKLKGPVYNPKPGLLDDPTPDPKPGDGK